MSDPTSLPIVRLHTCLRTRIVSWGATRLKCDGVCMEEEGGVLSEVWKGRKSNGEKINETVNFHDSWTTHRRKNTDISTSLSVKSPQRL